MEAGEGLVKSIVPLTGRGKVKYLLYEDLPEGGETPRARWILEHPKAVVLHIGRWIKLGGWMAHFEAYAAVERYDGEIVLVNPEASLTPGVEELVK